MRRDAHNSIYWNWKARLTKVAPLNSKLMLKTTCSENEFERKLATEREGAGAPPYMAEAPNRNHLRSISCEAVPVGVPDCGWPVGPSNTHSAGAALRVTWEGFRVLQEKAVLHSHVSSSPRGMSPVVTCQLLGHQRYRRNPTGFL